MTSKKRVHPDDLAVDRFSAAMKAKLAKKRAEGRGGWDDPQECTVDQLALYLIGHVVKGDPVDVGNLAMMLFNRKCGDALRLAALCYMRSMDEDTPEELTRLRADSALLHTMKHALKAPTPDETKL